jgi:hypothetical protein
MSRPGIDQPFDLVQGRELQNGDDVLTQRTRSPGSPRVNRLRLLASGARTAPPRGESLLELALQTCGRDVVFCLFLRRNLDPDPGGLEVDDLHVLGYVLPV